MHEFEDREHWHRRRKFLPHYEGQEKRQIITYRLSDSLPQTVLDELSQDETIRRKSIEKYLDNGYGMCILQRPKVAEIILNNWLYFDQSKYDLIAYVIMPNHVHVLIKTYKNQLLSKIIHSWKSYTAHEIMKVLEEDEQKHFNNRIWQIEYWDRFIRSEGHYSRAIEYIHNNPVKAGLCHNAKDWSWSSARAYLENSRET